MQQKSTIIRLSVGYRRCKTLFIHFNETINNIEKKKQVRRIYFMSIWNGNRSIFDGIWQWTQFVKNYFRFGGMVTTHTPLFISLVMGIKSFGYLQKNAMELIMITNFHGSYTSIDNRSWHSFYLLLWIIMCCALSATRARLVEEQKKRKSAGYASFGYHFRFVFGFSSFFFNQNWSR